MKTSRFLLCLCVSVLIAFATGISARGEDKPKRLTVSDYFVMLPPKTLEAPAANWLSFLRQPDCGVEDKANGFLSCTGDGAQPPFQVVLFRFKDDRPLLAVCQAELEGRRNVYVQLDFYAFKGKGRMVKAPRSIFPVKDSAFPIDERTAHSYELPRNGRTVLVRDLGSGKVRQKFTWNGERFVEEK
jgi:hypothetical protein